MTVIEITKPRPRHTMSILRNEPGDFEAYCPECGKHIFIIGRKFIAENNGDINAHHVYPILSKLGLQTLDFQLEVN